jgi:short-subunit dehydrogenase
MAHRTIAGRPLALVTGASSGIGRAIACEAARDGHDLIVTARRDDRLADLARTNTAKTPAQVTTLPEDLADRAGPERLWTEIERRRLMVDVLVNDAGLGIGAPFAQTEPQRLRDLLEINVATPLALMRLALPGMLARRRGRIANVASMAAFQPVPVMAAYAASKAFVLSLSEAAGEEVRGSGVTITAICAGTTRTAFFAAAGYQRPENFTDSVVAMSPENVAAIARAGIMAGTPLVVPGHANRATAVLGRLLPRRTLARAAMRVMAQRR